ncbi:alpha/beta hydrolase [Dokdonia sinensis]|uniref:Alpha/beta hydrolase n=1 Tax=Dokdonia sinensis TaxID=2479847 RepID=A0A3M0FUQ4_9FLAO|nr:alpha/beta hydrolase-fold protein [Dokdonia sinensis]RMB56238.1 alpha/beta hydrolase [Dokdonia sinensis]
MKQIFFLLFAFWTVTCFSQNQFAEKEPFVIGETLTFQSDVLKEKRVVNIYLPPSYESENKKAYPVIYLLDGSADEDFIHIAGLVQFSTFPWAQLIPESIVVGIANVDRKRDFTYPTTNAKDKADFPTTGGSEKFIAFLENELQPLINRQYRTTMERTIIGQSLGGLLATEILWKKPELFSNYIIISPSLWWDDNSLLPLKRAPLDNPKKVFVAVGEEGPIMESGAMALTAQLKQDRLIQTSFKYLEDLDHSNTLHIAVYEGFKAIYKKDVTKD